MEPKDIVKRLMPLLMNGAAGLLGTPEERLPAGLEGLLANFGEACINEYLNAAGVHEADTIPYPSNHPTNRSFPSPAPPPKPAMPSIFTRPTKRPPGGKKIKRLPLPPPLPRGLKSRDK